MKLNWIGLDWIGWNGMKWDRIGREQQEEIKNGMG